MVRRRVIGTPIYIRVRPANIQRLILDLIHARRGGPTAVRDAIPVPRFMATVVQQAVVVLSGVVVYLRLFYVVVLVARSLVAVGRVVGRAARTPHRERHPATCGCGLVVGTNTYLEQRWNFAKESRGW